MTSTCAYIESEIGRFKFTADRSQGCPVELTIVRPKTSLPAGMSVERVVGVVMNAPRCHVSSQLKYVCHYEGSAIGSPCTGEHLEAQEWEQSGRLVVVGTEDEEALRARYPSHEIGANRLLVSYEHNEIAANILLIPEGCKLSLHFVLAENPIPEPVEMSAWFAVDIKHQNVNASDA